MALPWRAGWRRPGVRQRRFSPPDHPPPDTNPTAPATTHRNTSTRDTGDDTDTQPTTPHSRNRRRATRYRCHNTQPPLTTNTPTAATTVTTTITPEPTPTTPGSPTTPTTPTPPTTPRHEPPPTGRETAPLPRPARVVSRSITAAAGRTALVCRTSPLVEGTSPALRLSTWSRRCDVNNASRCEFAGLPTRLTGIRVRPRRFGAPVRTATSPEQLPLPRSVATARHLDTRLQRAHHQRRCSAVSGRVRAPASRQRPRDPAAADREAHAPA